MSFTSFDPILFSIGFGGNLIARPAILRHRLFKTEGSMEGPKAYVIR